MNPWPWNRLLIAPGSDRAAIKRAYAERLKGIDRERDIGAFQDLRAAYEAALELALRPLSEPDLEALAAAKLAPTQEDSEGVPPHPGEPRIGGDPVIEDPVHRIGQYADAEPITDTPETAARTEGLGRADVEEPDDAQIQAFAAEVFAQAEHLPDSDALMAWLEDQELLLSLAQVDRVSHALAKLLPIYEDIRYPMLAALVERFDWEALPRAPGLDESESVALQGFLQRRRLAELIATRQLPRHLQNHYDDLQKHLQPPFDFWRAFRVSSLLLRDLRGSVAALREAFGSHSELVVSRDAEAFLDAVQRGPSLKFTLAYALGRAYGFSTALIGLLIVITVLSRGVLFAVWRTLPLWPLIFAAWALLFGVIRLLRR